MNRTSPCGTSPPTGTGNTTPDIGFSTIIDDASGISLTRGHHNYTRTPDGKIEVVAQCDKVTIEKVADGVVSVDIEPYTTPGKKFLVGRMFRTYYPQFGETDEDALANIIDYIGGVCQARDIESRYLFQLAQRK